MFLFKSTVVNTYDDELADRDFWPPAKALTDMRLKAAFGGELRRTAAGLNDNIQLCRDEYYAYFWASQRVYMENIARYPSPEVIKHQYPDAGEFLDPLWEATNKAYSAFNSSAGTLKAHWAACPKPDLPDFASELTAKPEGYFDGLDTNSIQVSALDRPYLPENGKQQLELWKTTERALRGDHYRCCKELLRSLRFYIEIVIDYAQKVEDKTLLESVLFDNRHLRELDAILHACVVERSIHYNQRPQRGDKDKRERKTGGPYSDHPVEATLFLSRHYTAFAMAKKQLGSSTPFLAPTISEPCHDAAEDSRYTVKRVITTLRNELNHIDSSLPQQIDGTPQGKSVEDFLREVLPLMREFTDEEVLTAVFRITNKNTVFTYDEAKKALERNIAGPDKTAAMLGITLDIPTQEPKDLTPEERRRFSHLPDRPLIATDYRTRKITKLGKPLETFTKFPDSHEPKMDQFLLRLFAISHASFQKSHHSSKRMAFHTSILDKLGDRWHNTKNMEPKNYAYRLTTLRGNVSRLLAFIMLDLDKDKYPLYNTLPEFIDLTLAEYEKLQAEWAALPDEQKALIDWKPCDDEHIAQLKTWQAEVERFDLSAVLDPEVLALTTSYNAKATKAADIAIAA